MARAAYFEVTAATTTRPSQVRHEDPAAEFPRRRHDYAARRVVIPPPTRCSDKSLSGNDVCRRTASSDVTIIKVSNNTPPHGLLQRLTGCFCGHGRPFRRDVCGAAAFAVDASYQGKPTSDEGCRSGWTVLFAVKRMNRKKTTTEIHSTQRNRRKILMKCFSFRTRYGWRDGCIIKENKIIVKYKLMTLWVMLLIFPKKRSRLNKTRFPENRARGKCGMNERQAWVGWKFLMDFSAIIFIWF